MRAIIIRSSAVLGDGPNSGLDDTVLCNSGLNMIGETDWGGDSVTLWTRTNLSWPSQDWPINWA